MDVVQVKRNPSIELYRIFLMFGICLLHCVCQGKWSGIWPCNLLGFCVPGVVFISGYFGVKFSLSKMIRIYSIPIYASLIAPLCGGAAVDGAYWCEVLRVWAADGGFWFIHAYALLMVLAPFVNALFCDNVKNRVAVILPLLVVVFGWGGLLNYNHLRVFVPAPSGLTAGSFLTFLGIYSVGRIFSVYNLGSRIPLMSAIIFTLVIAMVISLSKGYLSAVNNPACLLLAIALFIIFQHLKVGARLSKIVLNISPLMLAVYCISGTIYFPFTRPIFFSVVEFSKEGLYKLGFSIGGSVTLSALAVFIIGILFALPQYVMSCLLESPLHKMFKKIDYGFECLAFYIGSKLAAYGDKNK